MIFVPAGRPAVEKLRQSRSLLEAMLPIASAFGWIEGAVAGLSSGSLFWVTVTGAWLTAVFVVVPTIRFAVAVCWPMRKPASPWKSSPAGCVPVQPVASGSPWPLVLHVAPVVASCVGSPAVCRVPVPTTIELVPGLTRKPCGSVTRSEYALPQGIGAVR